MLLSHDVARLVRGSVGKGRTDVKSRVRARRVRRLDILMEGSIDD